MLHTIINSKSKTYLAFCFSFLAGVALASLVPISLSFRVVLVLISVTSFLLGLFWHHTTARFLVIAAACIGLGMIRYDVAFPKQYVSEGKQTITGYIAADPDVRIDGVRYIIEIINPKSEILNHRLGRVYLKTNLYPRHRYGDVLRVECDMKQPQPIIDRDDPSGKVFRYDMYLARYGVFAICQDPVIEKIGAGEGNATSRTLLGFKESVANRVALLWHEPYASFMAGLLYGYRGGLGELTEAFNRTGVSHIIAISGYNITIIATVLMTVLTFCYIRRQIAFWFVIAGIAAFVIFVGASPSVLRAAVMGFLVLLAKQIGRLSHPASMLLTAAVVMTAFNPFVLMWDAGFQLSFAATAGILYIAPLLEKKLSRLPELYKLKEIFIATVSAIAATLPLTLFHFGRFSVVAIIVNLLILITIPFIMIAGAVAIAFSVASIMIGQYAGAIAFIGMGYVVTVVQWFAAFSFASVEMQLPWWGMVSLYIMIIFFVYHSRKCVVLYE